MDLVDGQLDYVGLTVAVYWSASAAQIARTARAAMARAVNRCQDVRRRPRRRTRPMLIHP
jgi:hypothetical protein